MNKEEYGVLMDVRKANDLITAYDLKDRTDRTLLYGYTRQRHTWHVYLQQDCIYTVIYKYNEPPEQVEVNDNFSYVPDKKLYPETCDYEFCKLLKEKGVDLLFAAWQRSPEWRVYYGETL